MTLRIPAKVVLIHVWSYDFYDMMLYTGKQRRNTLKILISFYFYTKLLCFFIFTQKYEGRFKIVCIFVVTSMCVVPI